jgi:AAA+ superfamily predicted ATPase
VEAGTVAETVEFAGADPATQTASGLGQALEALAELLSPALEAAAEAYGPDAASDPYRGLYLAPRDMARLGNRVPLAPLWNGRTDPSRLAATVPRLARLGHEFGLDPVDLDILVIATAPELDLRYERIYAYLQDDVTRRRPTVDLVLDLVAGSLDEKLTLRPRLDHDGALACHELIRLVPDPNHVDPPLLSHYVVPDALVVRELLGCEGLDPRLQPFCTLEVPGENAESSVEPGLIEVVGDARGRRKPLVVHLEGPPGAGQEELARSLASALGEPLLMVDLAAMPREPVALGMALRASRVRRALPCLTSLDSIGDEERTAAVAEMLRELGRLPGPALVSTGTPWPADRGPMDVATIVCALPDLAVRRTAWRSALDEAEIDCPGSDIEELAGRFRLSRKKIEYAANRAAVAGRACGRAAGRSELFAAARAQSTPTLSHLARKVEAVYRWDDLVLPPDRLELLREICARMRHRALVHEEWGFEEKLSLGKGLTVLFAGPSGTGKTMAAEVMANELGLELYKIDLSAVVNKYIGETEKNLARVFDAAEGGNTILFFDEADALFGKRTEVRDSHDRYANVETSYLLQRVEEYDGMAILASNLRKNLDESFARRLQCAVEFPFPDAAARLLIWNRIWPAQIPLSEDLSFESFAERFELSGGSIRAVSLAAAFFAAEDGGHVTHDHVLKGIRREYEKLGKIVHEDELAAERAHAG